MAPARYRRRLPGIRRTLRAAACLVLSALVAGATQAQPQRVIACTTGGCTYPATLDPSTNQTVQGVHELFACVSITAGPYPIGSTGQVTFTAGETIGLRPGFSVAIGGTFLAVIDPNLAQ